MFMCQIRIVIGMFFAKEIYCVNCLRQRINRIKMRKKEDKEPSRFSLN
jgi:hypothetical protein